MLLISASMRTRVVRTPFNARASLLSIAVLRPAAASPARSAALLAYRSTSPAGLAAAAGDEATVGAGAEAGAGAGAGMAANRSETIQPDAPLDGSRTLPHVRPPLSRSAPITSSSVPSRIVRTSAAVVDGS